MIFFVFYNVFQRHLLLDRKMMNLKEAAHMIYDLFLFIGVAVLYITKTVISMLVPRRYRGKSIKDEIALVTGGASGIGKLIAIKLAKLGARVIVWDINKNGNKLFYLR